MSASTLSFSTLAPHAMQAQVIAAVTVAKASVKLPEKKGKEKIQRQGTDKMQKQAYHLLKKGVSIAVTT